MSELDDRELHALAEWLEGLRVYAPTLPTSISVADRLLLSALVKAAGVVVRQPFVPAVRPECTCPTVRPWRDWRPSPSCPLLRRAQGV